MVVILEAIAYGCSGVVTAIVGPTLASAPILIAGNDAQKKKYLASLVAEPIIAVGAFLRSVNGRDQGSYLDSSSRAGDCSFVCQWIMWMRV